MTDLILDASVSPLRQPSVDDRNMRRFAWKSRPACRRQREDLVLLAHVRAAFALSNETYGSPRVTHELRDQGVPAGRRRVARLMRENGLRARHPRRVKRTTGSLHAFSVAPNLLDQDFSAERPDEKWGADLSDELCGKVGDDGCGQAAYRGGCRSLPEPLIESATP